MPTQRRSQPGHRTTKKKAATPQSKRPAATKPARAAKSAKKAKTAKPPRPVHTSQALETDSAEEGAGRRAGRPLVPRPGRREVRTRVSGASAAAVRQGGGTPARRPQRLRRREGAPGARQGLPRYLRTAGRSRGEAAVVRRPPARGNGHRESGRIRRGVDPAPQARKRRPRQRLRSVSAERGLRCGRKRRTGARAPAEGAAQDPDLEPLRQDAGFAALAGELPRRRRAAGKKR
jgi:hypothetical protein